MADTSMMDAPAQHSTHHQSGRATVAVREPQEPSQMFSGQVIQQITQQQQQGSYSPDTFDFKATTEPTTSEAVKIFEWRKKIEDNGNYGDTFDADGDYALTSVDHSATDHVGDTVTFTITITNDGWI
jgi:hypothetical protein